MSFRIVTRPYVCQSCKIRLQVNNRRAISFDGTSKAEAIVPVRTRFAPSPTGHLHFGSLRTALYNYLYAKKRGGTFILRLEDTDDKRTVPGAEQRIYDDLRWARLNWDEGPEVGGRYGPYKQSIRTPIYRFAASQLIESGHAYRCFCSAEELRLKDEAQLAAGFGTGYDRTCYHLTKEQSDDWAAQNRSHVVRLKDPETQPMLEDLTFGRLPRATKQRRRMDTAGIYEDIVLIKTDGIPTYHLANVVDDHYMKISHVIRGAEWLISTHKHLALYKAFGWTPPRFAHVGLLLDEQQQKLSKRDQTFNLEALKHNGLLSEALLNFLVLLGWKHAKGNEVMMLKQMEELFDINFNKTNPIVKLGKLWYFSSQHVKRAFENPDTANRQNALYVVNAVVAAVRRVYSTADLESVGLNTEKELVSRCTKLLMLRAASYTTATEFVESLPQFFTDRLSPEVERPIFAKPREALLDHHSAALWSQEAVRASVLDALMLSPSKNSSIDRDASSNAFSHSGPELIQNAIDDLIAQYTSTYRQQLNPSADQSSEPADKHGNPAYFIPTYINTLLRGWLCFGRPGPTVAETMHILGPELSRGRIQRGQVVWVDQEDPRVAKQKRRDELRDIIRRCESSPESARKRAMGYYALDKLHGRGSDAGGVRSKGKVNVDGGHAGLEDQGTPVTVK